MLFEILFGILNSEGTRLGLGRNQNKKQSIFSSTTQREMHGFHMTIFNNYMDYFFIYTLRLVLTGKANVKTHFIKSDKP